MVDSINLCGTSSVLVLDGCVFWFVGIDVLFCFLVGVIYGPGGISTGVGNLDVGARSLLGGGLIVGVGVLALNSFLLVFLVCLIISSASSSCFPNNLP